ncbi:MAG TPA: gamma-glutamyltransferase [Gemmatimonadaceae bacterium]|nr:gamma-glutamyltransferase [Gemmatimonadaceae bacterium]
MWFDSMILRRLTILTFAVGAVATCRPPFARDNAPFPPAWRFSPGRGAAYAANAMVSSNDSIASLVGVEVLRRGGNAVDAAVAVGFALAVTYPEAGNLGGGGYMVIRMADGRTAALDYRERAPMAATRDMYARLTDSLPRASLVGHLASGVPGAVAGMVEAHSKYGALPLADVIAPAIRLADSGFVVDSALARSIENARELIAGYAGGSVFVPNGSPLARGSRLVQPDLANTLRRIAAQGAPGFYEGETARLMVEEMRRGGGIITEEDLRQYRPVWRGALEGTYRSYRLITMPPSSSGGVTMLETLNILETVPALPPFGSTKYTHLLTEAFRRAFIDRNTKLGDPDFVDVPVRRLTSDAYARELATTIDSTRASQTGAFDSTAREATHTTHYSVVDAAGNAVATTTTINELYGSGVFIPGAGFFMNNEMDDFATRPGEPNLFGLVQGETNAIAPGKRMLSAMSPTIVLDSAGRVALVLGGRGGPRIISSTLQVIVNVVDHGMTLADALAAPRIHHQAWPDTLRYETNGLAPAVVDSLRAMGHAVAEGRATGLVKAIMRAPAGGWYGAYDPRTTGGASGY